MHFAFFGSSLVSAYWNGAATYYRGLLRELSLRGHELTFYEPDAFGRQEHRDMPDPAWCRVVVYPPDMVALNAALSEAAAASDILVKFSGVGVLDREIEEAVAELASPGRSVIFWDVDAPATLEEIRKDEDHPLRTHIPQYDAVFTYGGGDKVVSAYLALGARDCVPIYNGVDTTTHHPVASRNDYASDLSFLGNRLPDREGRVDDFFFDAARRLTDATFVIGGSGWDARAIPGNVRNVGHVFTRDHNAFNCSARAILNVTRDSMARNGASPPTRIFEAAGAGACILTDAWEGIDAFFAPGSEILPVGNGCEVAETIAALSAERALAIGLAAHRRALAHHTYRHRAAAVEAALEGRDTPREAAQ
jgi:spore maturation protein CgeB